LSASPSRSPGKFRLGANTTPPPSVAARRRLTRRNGCRSMRAGIRFQRMQTLVIQSYRTRDVAAWISACLRSVQAWAAAAGYRYEFVDDRLFDYAPAWVRERCGKQLLPITDVARMYLLRERLAHGWDRVIWVDADVLVFAP